MKILFAFALPALLALTGLAAAPAQAQTTSTQPAWALAAPAGTPDRPSAKPWGPSSKYRGKYDRKSHPHGVPPGQAKKMRRPFPDGPIVVPEPRRRNDNRPDEWRRDQRRRGDNQRCDRRHDDDRRYSRKESRRTERDDD